MWQTASSWGLLILYISMVGTWIWRGKKRSTRIYTGLDIVTWVFKITVSFWNHTNDKSTGRANFGVMFIIHMICRSFLRIQCNVMKITCAFFCFCTLTTPISLLMHMWLFIIYTCSFTYCLALFRICNCYNFFMLIKSLS